MIQYSPPTPVPLIYEGSAKNVRGPLPGTDLLGFEFTDYFSVFDWGRMPSPLPGKGEALAVMTDFFFEHLEGAGIRSHYVGALSFPQALPERGMRLGRPFRWICVRPVNVCRPKHLERGYDYSDCVRNPALPQLLPFEVVFRWGVVPGSSLLEQIKKDPAYLERRGFKAFDVQPQKIWTTPTIEFFTKLESTDRPLELEEAQKISGLSVAQLQNLMSLSQKVAVALQRVIGQAHTGQSKLQLIDGKMEWGMSEKGEFFLVDSIGPDELRIQISDGASGRIDLSKEFLRKFYRNSNWYQDVKQVKGGQFKTSNASPSPDWKSQVKSTPPELPAEWIEAAKQIYLVLANTLTGHTWFRDAWPLSKLVTTLRGLTHE